MSAEASQLVMQRTKLQTDFHKTLGKRNWIEVFYHSLVENKRGWSNQ